MAEIKKIGIQRKIYEVKVSKKYLYSKSYRIREVPPIVKIKKALGLSGSKKKEAKKEKQEMAPKTGFNPIIMIGAILLALFLVMAVWIYSAGQTQPPPQPVVTITKSILNNEIIDTGIITAGDRTADQYIAYAKMNTMSNGLAKAIVTITPYEQKIPSEIFILISERQQASGYNEFASELKNEAKKKKRTVNEITVSELKEAPQGAIVVIPSGNIPKELLELDGRNIMDLANKGFVIVYIGLPFDKMLDGSRVVSTPKNITDKLGINFAQGASQSDGNISLYQPLYSAGGGNIIYGSISAIRHGKGNLIFLPQTLDGGWRGDMKAAAKDVARIIFETKWASPIADSSTYHIRTEKESIGNYFTFPIKIKEGSLKIEVAAYNKDEDIVASQEEWVTAPMEKETPGELYIDGGYSVTPTYLSGKPVRMNALLDNEGGGQRFLAIAINNATSEVKRNEQGEISLIGETSLDVPIQLDTGEYIATLTDDEGLQYAQTYMQISSINIVYTGQEDRGKYGFDIYKGNSVIKLDGEVSVNEGQYGKQEFKDLSHITVDLLQATSGEDLPYGKHKFAFRIGEIEKIVEVDRSRPSTPFDENPLLLVVIVLAIVVVGGGAMFARKDEPSYQLDIPDFPPIARTKIPLRSETILGLFEKVNQDYKWETTPLSVAELKGGFKDILYQGKPIFISDYNMEYILDQLQGKKIVNTFLDYYAPVSWADKSKKSINYLCMFRRLRDIFVNNAVPFTARGEEKDVATKITIVGQDMYVHLMDSLEKTAVAELAGEALETTRKGIAIIVFSDDDDKARFESLLASTSQGLLLLKIEIEGGSVLLRTISEFEKMIRELRGV